jgi:DNA polymerase-3 subunit epsilon
MLRRGLDQPLAIVDVETTGTSSAYHRVIEVAVLRVEEGKVVRRFESLVNPERYISPFIEQITGITNESVAEAPVFGRIAGKLLPLFRDALLVAHNARFDLAFLQSEFARLGKRFQPKTLCTVKLSRRLFPGERRHDLSSLIERHELSCTARHRAMGDAEAVLSFLELLGRTVSAEILEKVTAELLRSRTLPPHLDPETLEALPETPGVYLMYGRHGQLLYVGMSKNVRDRVLDHFSSRRELDMCQQIGRVEVRSTAGELGAALLELHLIKTLRPMYNQVSRSTRPLIVLLRTVDRDGYARVRIVEGEEVRPGDAQRVLATFKSRRQAERFLADAAKRHSLCHKLLGLEESRSHCFAYHLHRCNGACAGEEPAALYNARLDQAFARRRVTAWPFGGSVVIREEGPDGSGEVFLLDQWRLLGGVHFTELGHEPFLDRTTVFDYDSYKVLARYLRNPAHRRAVRVLRSEEFEEFLRLTSADPA